VENLVISTSRDLHFLGHRTVMIAESNILSSKFVLQCMFLWHSFVVTFYVLCYDVFFLLSEITGNVIKVWGALTVAMAPVVPNFP
jgi:hypothetical protein